MKKIKKAKKTLSLFLAVMMVASLAGCGSGSSIGTGSGGSTETGSTSVGTVTGTDADRFGGG